MKHSTQKCLVFLSCAAAALVMCGCAHEHPKTVYQSGYGPDRGFGPSWTIEENGIPYQMSAMAFPTGPHESTGLVVEKKAPMEVRVGKPFEYTYKVINTTEHPIQVVVLTDRVTGSFTPGDATPAPTELKDGVATWKLGTLTANQTTEIKVRAIPTEEGSLNTCGWASYNPVLCGDIKVVKPDLQISKAMPGEVTICDAIPVTITVKNSGSCKLTGVKVTESLSEGLLGNGQRTLVFDAGTLAPGESKDFSFNASAAHAGKYTAVAQATAAEDVQVESSTSTLVHEPLLQVGSAAPAERYVGQTFEVTYTVINKGDAPAAGVVLTAPIPAGLSFKSATAGGQVSGDKVVWDLGSIAPNGEQAGTATFTCGNMGTFEFTASTKGTCAKEVAVATPAATKFMGVAGILIENVDDRDPIQVGETTTYTVKVMNQGTADDSNLKLTVTLPEELVPLEAPGSESIKGQVVTFPALSTLPAKQVITYTITAKGVKTGDAHTRATLTSSTVPTPLINEESTHVY